MVHHAPHTAHHASEYLHLLDILKFSPLIAVEKEEEAVVIDMQEPVTLNFALRYLSLFTKVRPVPFPQPSHIARLSLTSVRIPPPTFSDTSPAPFFPSVPLPLCQESCPCHPFLLSSSFLFPANLHECLFSPTPLVHPGYIPRSHRDPVHEP